MCGDASRSNGSYVLASGTSMAVPHVAGAAALFLQAHPSAHPSEVKRALLASAAGGRIDPAALREGTPNSLLCTEKLLLGV